MQIKIKKKKKKKKKEKKKIKITRRTNKKQQIHLTYFPFVEILQ